MIRTPRTLIAIAASAALLLSAPLIAANTASNEPVRYVTQDNDNLWNLAAPYERGLRVTRQQWMVAVLRRNPDAFVLGNMHRLRSKVSLQLPTEAEAAAESLPAAEALIVRHFAGLNGNQAMPLLQAPTPAKTAEPSVAAPATTPAAAPATAAAASTASTVAPAPTPAITVTPPAQAAEPSSLRRWLPHTMAAAVALLALGMMWRVRRRNQPLTEAVSTFFQDTIQLVRKSKPKVVTFSTAGADVARSVEKLASTAHLVRTQDEPADTPAITDPESAIKLEIARAQIEVGRQDAAIAMLKALVRSGAPAQRQSAQQLLGSLGAA